jgi:uncharacterized damage-inducible protein DinB
MSLGQLALHIAAIPGSLAQLAQKENHEVSDTNFNAPLPRDAKEIFATLDASVKTAEEYLGTVSDSAIMGTWRLNANGKEVLAMPRVALLRSIMLNHWYHHRGQLSVYLRLLDVPVPVIYGRSADENPFA